MAGAESLHEIFEAIGGLKRSIEHLTHNDVEASRNRRAVYEKLESLGRDMTETRAALLTINARIDRMEPGWQDYLNKQQQVKGAGQLGRALWWLGGVVLSAAAALMSAVTWIGGSPPK